MEVLLIISAVVTTILIIRECVKPKTHDEPEFPPYVPPKEK